MRTRIVALVVAIAATGLISTQAGADNNAIRDGKNDSRLIKQKPEIDIVRASAGHAVKRVKHKITMRGKLTPKKKNTRPFLLINTKGGEKSDFEYLVLGPRVFKKTNDGFKKVGANKFTARKRTWVYRFKAKKLGVKKEYGWAALTAKGKATDLAPDGNYATHDLRK